MTSRIDFSAFHPTLRKLLEKLADPKFSVRDTSGERMDWVKAGCPIYLVTFGQDDDFDTE